MESGGLNPSAEPGVARDLQRMGFNLTAFANNHTLNSKHDTQSFPADRHY